MFDDRKFTVEIKSVNHRYNDITVKLPRSMNEFEDPVKKLMQREIIRGKTDVYINFESFSKNDVNIKYNEPMADALTEQLRAMKERYQTTDGISLNILTRFPDIITVDKNTMDSSAKDCLRQGLFAAAEAALSEFVRMREAEGHALKDDILKKLDTISSRLDIVEKRAPAVLGSYRDKLLNRLNELIGDIEFKPDENRLYTEMLLFADKVCIDEEITRLKSHILQMTRVLNEDDAVGRKLDFLAQEMNREINTIGSKANDLEIAGVVVELKSELEKIREQVQNIE